jgi:hypothetical protein
VQLLVEVDGCHTPEALYEAVRRRLHQQFPAAEARDLPPVVELRLEGMLRFDRRSLDMQFIADQVEEIAAPLVALPRDHSYSEDSPIGTDETLSRSELERKVFHRLVSRDGRFAANAGRWSDLVSEVKAMVLGGSTPEAIVSAMERRIAAMDEE